MKSLLSVMLMSSLMSYSAQKLQLGIVQTSIIQKSLPTIIERTQKARQECDANRLTAARWLLSVWSSSDEQYLKNNSEANLVNFLEQRNITVDNLKAKLEDKEICFVDENKEKIEQILCNVRNNVVSGARKELPSIYHPQHHYVSACVQKSNWGSQTQDLASQIEALESSKKQDATKLKQLNKEHTYLTLQINNNSEQIAQIQQEMIDIKSVAIQQLCKQQITALLSDNNELCRQQHNLENQIKQNQKNIVQQSKNLKSNGIEMREKYDDALQQHLLLETQENNLLKQLKKVQEDKNIIKQRIAVLGKTLFTVSQNNVEIALNKEL